MEHKRKTKRITEKKRGKTNVAHLMHEMKLQIQKKKCCLALFMSKMFIKVELSVGFKEEEKKTHALACSTSDLRFVPGPKKLHSLAIRFCACACICVCV